MQFHIKKTQKILFVICALLLGLSCEGLQAANLRLLDESRLWLEGDSTLHPFSSTAAIVNISAELAGGQTDALKPGALEKFDLSVEVKSLKSGKKGLDKKMYETLKSDKFPNIVFRMAGYEIEASSAGVIPVKAKGTLSIAGKDREIDLNLEARQKGEGLRVSGSETLLMSDYGIKPPSMMLGAVKTADKITVRFNLLLEVQTTTNTKEAR